MLSTTTFYFNTKNTTLIQRVFKFLLISSHNIPLLKSKFFLLKKRMQRKVLQPDIGFTITPSLVLS